MNFQASVLVFSTLVAFSYQNTCTNQTKQQLSYGDFNCVFCEFYGMVIKEKFEGIFLAGGNVYSTTFTFKSLTPRSSGAFFKIKSVVSNSYVELVPLVFLLDGPPNFVSAVTQTVRFKAS